MFFVGGLQAIRVRHLYRVYWNKEVCRPVLSDLLKVLFREFVGWLKPLLMFIGSRCKVDEVLIYI
jgi:hypothetical protein